MSTDNSDNVIPFVNTSSDVSAVSKSHAKGNKALDADNAVCEFCFGTGTRLKSDTEGGKGSVKGAVVCDCRRTNLRDQLFKASRIPLLFRKCLLDSYHAASPTQKWALDYSRRLVKEYPDVGRGLLFMGSVGVGKTHLAVAIISSLIEEKGIPCLFYESGSLLKAIQDSYNPISETSEMRLLAPVYQAEVLVLDELGASVPSSWVRDTLYQIINTRYMDRKLTIFTTNYFDEVPEAGRESHENSDDLRDNRSFALKRIQKLTPLEERIGTPLRSRLFEMCNTLEIKGADYRKRFHDGLSPVPR
jgi:DNA replication protein DnaC